MELYNGKFLNIKLETENNRFVLFWHKSPTTIKEFKSEILKYISIKDKHNADQFLWLNQNFKFQMDEDCKSWFEKTVIASCNEDKPDQEKQGHNDNICLVIGKDILAQMENIGVYQLESPSGFLPRYFAEEKEARDWLDGKVSVKKNEGFEVNFIGLDDQGQSIIEIKDSHKDIGLSIKTLKKAFSEKEFLVKKSEKFTSLTSREKETLSWIIQGYSNKEVSLKMNISPNTVRTHRNRIWQKLNISNNKELYEYSYFFE